MVVMHSCCRFECMIDIHQHVEMNERNSIDRIRDLLGAMTDHDRVLTSDQAQELSDRVHEILEKFDVQVEQIADLQDENEGLREHSTEIEQKLSRTIAEKNEEIAELREYKNLGVAAVGLANALQAVRVAADESLRLDLD